MGLLSCSLNSTFMTSLARSASHIASGLLFRHDLEDKKSSPDVKCLADLARDVMKVELKEYDDNPISFPVNRANGTPGGPDGLLAAIDDMDLRLGKHVLHARFEEGSKPLETAIRQWLKHLTSGRKVPVCHLSYGS